MPPATNIRIIATVIISIAILALIGMMALSYALVMGGSIDQSLGMAFFGLEGSLIGYLGGVLSNTRSQPASEEISK